MPVYVRDQATGEVVLNELNEPTLDSDFAAILDEFLRSPAAHSFSWLLEDREIPEGAQSWSVAIEDVAQTKNLSLDAKRLSFKVHSATDQIKQTPHVKLGDVLEVVPVSKFRSDRSKEYRYVEIQRVGAGDYDYEVLRGWQLPQRARLRAKAGDLFVANIWSCAGKWFVAAGDCSDLVVTNGFTRLRFKPGMADEYWPDVATGLCSEAFRVQMRALTTGSDGLAEIADEDLLSIVFPRISKKSRVRVKERLAPLLEGDSTFGKAAQHAMDTYPAIEPRKSHCSVV